MSDLAQLRRKIEARHSLPAPAVRRALREGAGISQADVAIACGVSREAVSRWENGEREPRPDHLAAYVEVLDELRRSG
jgi:transcriptional regulator with XRE-family HTH domain